MVHSSTAEEISPIDSRFAVHEEAAIATNTGNTVEQHEHLINVIENKVDRIGLELKRTNLDVDALGETVDGMPAYDENNRKRTFLALSRVSHSPQHFAQIDTNTSPPQIAELADK